MNVDSKPLIVTLRLGSGEEPHHRHVLRGVGVGERPVVLTPSPIPGNGTAERKGGFLFGEVDPLPHVNVKRQSILCDIRRFPSDQDCGQMFCRGTLQRNGLARVISETKTK